MRLFTDKDQEKLDRAIYERDMAFEAAQRLMEANLRFLEETTKLAAEVSRLSQRREPVIPDGEIEQPKSVRDNDDVVLEDPERMKRPEPPRPARVE